MERRPAVEVADSAGEGFREAARPLRKKETGVDPDYLLASFAGKAQERVSRRVLGDVHLQAVAVAVGGRAGHDVSDLHVAETTYPVQGVRDLAALGGDLHLIGDVLPLTAPARAEVGAWRGPPVGRGLHDGGGTRLDEPSAIRSDLGVEQVARAGTLHEDDAPVIGMSHTGSAGGESLDTQGAQFHRCPPS